MSAVASSGTARSSPRSLLGWVAPAAAVGVALGFVYGWSQAVWLAEPGGSGMDDEFAAIPVYLAAGAAAAVGVVLLVTRFRRGGAAILLGAACAIGGFHVAMAVGPREPVALTLTGTLTLTIDGSQGPIETVAADCITTPRGDALDRVFRNGPIGPFRTGVVVHYVDEPSIGILVDDDVRYVGPLPGLDPATEPWSGSSPFTAEIRGPASSAAPTVISGTVSWSCPGP